MAGAFALACLGKIGDVVLGEIGDCFVAPIQRQFTYMCCFNSNITELETQFKKLETTRQGVQLGVDDDRRNVRIVGPNVETWLTSANEVTTEVEGIIQDKAKAKEGCLNGWCPNLKLRYSLSRKAVKKTTVVVDLCKDGDKYTQSSYNPPPASLETIPNRDFKGFESRRLVVEQIIKALKHDEINLIGVCGMAGVGKTTMVNEVAKRAKEDNHFDEVAIAVVGQEPNLANVQDCIAEMLGLKELCETKSPIVRADRLCKRLVQDNKKVLVILDDIWKEFDLQAMGIPLDGANKNFKMLYTSRFRDLWHDVRTKKEIPLELLSEDEAWQLFREKAGDLADARDLQPIAKQIVRECGRLPLALVLIGSALSKKSGRNWEGMLDRLTCARSTPADNQLHSRLELSYEFLEDKEAKRLFLLCCIFQEDEDIRIEDLARYGFGLSLFDGINEMAKVRRLVFYIVDDLKSRYLLLNGEKEECVKVHDVVRDMGISIASKDKYAIVSHGAVSEWPKTITHEHYIAISVISEKIKELPEGLTYPNLEFLMLRCRELEKLPPDFFEGMGKLKVLELTNFHGILTFQPLKNLTTLALEAFCGKLDNVRVIGDLLNLEILSFRGSKIGELPEEIRELVKLRLLDLSRMDCLERIPPGVLACLVHLEELYVHSNFEDWEGEGQKEGRNANLKEFESLSHLNTLEIVIKKHVVVPKLPILGKLKKYKVIQDDLWEYTSCGVDNPYERQLMITQWNWDTPAGRGGIDTLLRSSDCLFLREGSNDLVQLLLPNGVDRLQQLKYLEIEGCDTPEYLANTINPVQPPPNATTVFSILEELHLDGLRNLREICCGPVPAGSFGQLTKISIYRCERLGNLFHLPIVGRLAQLKSLTIKQCVKMEEVIGEDVQVAPNRIEFPKLEYLCLDDLPSLIGFCGRIDQIDFPNLKELLLEDLRKVNSLFHNNNNLSSNSKQNDNIVCFLSLFPKKVSLPNLEVLSITKLENLETLGHGPLPVGSLFKLRDCSVRACGKLLCVFPSQLVPMLRNLEKLTVEDCDLLEVVFELDGVDSNEPNPKLKVIKLWNLPKLNYISKRGPMDFKYIQSLEISNCDSLRYVFGSTMTKSIPQLRVLSICFCKMMSAIVAEENGLGESLVDEVEFPQLETLNLWNLPNLVSFFPNVNANPAKSTDQLHNAMQPQPLFNQKVAFPRLESLYLDSLPNVSDIWCSEVSLPNLDPEIVSSTLKLVKLWVLPNLIYISKRDPMVFKYIQTLDIWNCYSLRYVFAPTMTKSVPQLRELKIMSCQMMSRIVAEENGMGESSVDEVKFPQLERLELCDLPNLMSFFPNVNTALPESTDGLHNPMQPQSLFNEKVAIPSLKYLKLLGLKYVSDLWCSKLPSSSFSKLENLNVGKCASLRNMFHPSMAGGLVNLKELLIEDCSNLEAVVGKEEEVEGGHGIKVDKTLFPQMGKLHLRSLPNLRMFCHFAHPLKLPLLSEMVILFCPSMDVFSLGHVSTPNLSSSSLWGYGDLFSAKQLLQENGDDPMATSMKKPRTLDYVTDKSKSWQEVAETQCRLVAMPERIDGPHKVARLLYTNSGNGVLALGCNGSMRLWKWGSSEHNPSGKATASVVPQQWQPASGLAMTNDVTGAKLEEAVPCIALSKNDSFVISACGGVISLFDMTTFQVRKKFKPPPPASTFLAVYPQDNDVIAIGMEDSTIHIYNVMYMYNKEILEGHQKRITGLVFSTNLNILVSSGADAQLCIWSIDTWEKLKSVPIQLPAGKACNGDTRVQFHSNQIDLLVSHETLLAIYDPSRDRIRQCISQDVLPAPISCATYSCDSKLVYTSFCDGNIGVFDADSLTLRCHIAPSVYLSPALLSGSQDVYPLVVAAHPQQPLQFAIGLTDGSVIVMELPTIIGLDGGMASSSNASNQTPDQGEVVDHLDKDVDEDVLIMTRTRTATTHDDDEDLEEKRKKEEEKKEKKGKSPISG